MELEVELKALEITQLRVVAADSQAGHGTGANSAASILKIKGTELQQALTEMVVELAGPEGLAMRPEAHGANAPLADGWIEAAAPYYFNMRKVSIFGGSNEIQRNIVAKTVLGL
ncbi:MAG: acyl-CoA dehydrogenase family protein [Rhodospirillales bacterium]